MKNLGAKAWLALVPSVVVIGLLLFVREVTENQKVISTGPYAIVRHPMYASGSLYLLSTPTALGSYCGLVPVAAMIPFLIWRLLDEERFLATNLPGYTEYQKRIRYHLVPFVW